MGGDDKGETHVEKVEPRTVHVDQELVRARRWDGLWCVLRELEFGRVSVFCDDKRLHGWSLRRSEVRAET